jgi:hypothetical protein
MLTWYLIDVFVLVEGLASHSLHDLVPVATARERVETLLEGQIGARLDARPVLIDDEPGLGM